MNWISSFRISTVSTGLLACLTVLGLCLSVSAQTAGTKPDAKAAAATPPAAPAAAEGAQGKGAGDKEKQSVSLFDVYRLAFERDKVKNTKAPSSNNAEAATEPVNYFGLTTFFQQPDMETLKREMKRKQLPTVTMGGGDRYNRHVDAVTSLFIFPDGQHVLSSSADKTAQLWTLSDRKPMRVFQDEMHHKQGVTDVAVTPRGDYVLTASYDGSIRVWNIKSGKNVKSFLGLRDRVWAVAVAPNGMCVAGASDEGKIIFWDPTTMKKLGVLEGNAGPVYDLRFFGNRSSMYLLSACADGVARIYDMAQGKEVQALSGHQDKIYSAVFSSDMSMVLTASRDKTARLWNTYTGEELCRFVGHVGAVRSAIFYEPPKPEVGAQGSVQQTAMDGGQASAQAPKFLVITGSDDGTVRTWVPDLTKKKKDTPANGREGGPGQQPEPQPGGDLGMGNAPTGGRIFSHPSDFRDEEEQNEDGTTKKKKRSSAREPGKNKGIEVGNTVAEPGAQSVAVYSMALTPDMRRILLGCSDGMVRVWNITVTMPGAKKKKK